LRHEAVKCVLLGLAQHKNSPHAASSAAKAATQLNRSATGASRG
jgi:hypothetical protein